MCGTGTHPDGVDLKGFQHAHQKCKVMHSGSYSDHYLLSLQVDAPQQECCESIANHQNGHWQQ